MRTKNYSTPKLDRQGLIVFVLGLSVVTSGYVWLQKSNQMMQASPELYFVISCLVSGSLFGVLASGCWVATVFRRRGSFFLAQGFFVVFIATAMWQIRGEYSPIPALTDCLGLVLAQNIVFAQLRIPRWEITLFAEQRNTESLGEGAADTDALLSKAPPPHQFSIFDLILVTTIFAVLLALGQRHAISINPELYWAVLAGIWIVMPLIAAAICSAFLTSSMPWRLIRLFLAFLISVGALVAVTALEWRATNSRDLLKWYLLSYAMIFGGYFSVLCLVAHQGRVVDSR